MSCLCDGTMDLHACLGDVLAREAPRSLWVMSYNFMLQVQNHVTATGGGKEHVARAAREWKQANRCCGCADSGLKNHRQMCVWMPPSFRVCVCPNLLAKCGSNTQTVLLLLKPRFAAHLKLRTQLEVSQAFLCLQGLSTLFPLTSVLFPQVVSGCLSASGVSGVSHPLSPSCHHHQRGQRTACKQL